MKSSSFPDPDQVLDELGDSFTHAFIDAVDGARDDFREFKEWHPDWAIGYSSRFIANFAHERIWDRLIRQIDGLPGITIRDDEPFREISHGTAFVTRVKRHHAGEKISAYPTSGSLAHWSNRAVTIPTLDQLSLAIGYYWDADTRSIGDAVLSLRESFAKPVWGVTLARAAAAPAQITWDPIDPGLPELDLSQVAVADEEEGLA